MAQPRTSPLSTPSSVVNALQTSDANGGLTPDRPGAQGPTEISSDGPPPGSDPSFSAEMPDSVIHRESRIIRPETLTRKYDEAERRIRRQVTQQMERGIRVVPPVNISALEQGGYTVTSGSRVGYDLKRFSGQNVAGGELGKSEGRTTSQGGGRTPTVNTRVGRGGPPVDASGRDLLNRYTDVPGVDSARSGMAGRRSSANPRGLLNSAERLSRSRAF